MLIHTESDGDNATTVVLSLSAWDHMTNSISDLFDYPEHKTTPNIRVLCVKLLLKDIVKLHWPFNNSLANCESLTPATATDWSTKAVMCYHVYVIVHVKDP